MRLAVTLIVWISEAPLVSVDNAVVGTSVAVVTSAAYPFTDTPINAKPISIEVRRLICCFITNTS